MKLLRDITSGVEVEPEDKPLVLFAQVGVHTARNQRISKFVISVFHCLFIIAHQNGEKSQKTRLHESHLERTTRSCCLWRTFLFLKEPDQCWVLRLCFGSVGELARPAEGQEKPRDARPQRSPYCHWWGSGRRSALARLWGVWWETLDRLKEQSEGAKTGFLPDQGAQSQSFKTSYFPIFLLIKVLNLVHLQPAHISPCQGSSLQILQPS